MRTEHDIDKRKLPFDILGFARLLRHTPAHGDQKRRFAFFELFQRPDIPEGVIFGVLADTAGIKDDNIRFFLTALLIVAAGIQNARDLLRFV